MNLFLQVTDPDRTTLVELLRAYWPIVVTAVLGFVGIYGLLPQARRSKAVWGGLVLAVAILAGGRWLIHYEGVWPERLLFYAFSLLALLGGVFMLAQQNPVHAALSFALVVLSTCGLFLLLHAPFLMAATIIIYAGAIVVTFLFVIMLAQQAGLGSADARSREPFLASLAGFVLLGALWMVLDRTYDVAPLLGQLERAAAATSFEDVAQLWGDPGPKPAAAKSPAAFHELKQRFPEDLVHNLDHAWSRRDLPGVKKHAAALVAQAAADAPRRGTVKPAGAPPARPLPAQNVAALGRTLFSDYLVPVELAGVLLLVATIGAIVIALRRGEGLR